MRALPHWPALRSLRLRLLLATLAVVALALALAWLGLGRLFRDHVQQQFQTSLAQQLDQVTARFALDAQGRPGVDGQALSDPRWQQPLSGLYWQVDAVAPDGSRQVGVLRSRSLWDSVLQAGSDALADGEVHVHERPGPRGPVLLLERTVRVAAPDAGQATPPEGPTSIWTLLVAADLAETQAAVARFNRLLAASLLLLLALLAAAAWAQVAVGLQPLHGLQQGLRDVQSARTERLEGRFPSEVQPLVDDFNRVLAQNHAVVERARTQAGNLAHALKTPLSVLEHLAAAQAPPGQALAQQVREQVQVARRHIDWHLARARVAATQRLPGQRTAVLPVAEGLLRVMRKVHAERGLTLELVQHPADAPPPYFAGEEQDLQEMLGNLLDNACKWARTRVRVVVQQVTLPGQPADKGMDQGHGQAAGAAPGRAGLQITVQDDGPGIGPAHREAVKVRGARLDESVPGTGLGLAIVQELAGLYGGSLELHSPDAEGAASRVASGAPSPVPSAAWAQGLGGLQASLRLRASEP